MPWIALVPMTMRSLYRRACPRSSGRVDLCRRRVLERELREADPLGLDLVDHAASHGERLPGVLVRDPVDHLERRVALARRDDRTADASGAVGPVVVGDRYRHTRVAGHVAGL